MELKYKNIKFALDIGTRSVIGSVGIIEDGKLKIIKECYIEHEERAMVDGQIHDIGLVANVVKKVVDNLEKSLGITLEKVSIAAAGRYLKTVKSSAVLEINKEQAISKDLIRTLELTALKEGENIVGEDLEGSLYCVGYSIINYYLNGYLISNLLDHKGESMGVEIISTFLPEVVVESLYSVMNMCNLKVNNLTLEPIAAIEAVIPQNLRLLNIALVDIGAGTSDIAISSNKTVSAYGMVPFAGDEITEVIANECLVDFNCAETIKRKINIEDEIKFTDVIGLENIKTSEELKEIIEPSVIKMASEISENILSLNGGKAPSAIFLVGGGAHTPLLIDKLSELIGLQKQRIAIKDRDGITNCICENSLGSSGVTVVGIALVGMKDDGHDFVDVYLNDEPISLFNSFKHTVADVLVAADIDPGMLIGKYGKNLKFILNDKSKIVFGQSGSNSIIKVNGDLASIETAINEGDKINIKYAINGENGGISAMDLIEEFNSKSFYINEELFSTHPILLVDNIIVDDILNYSVKDGDNLTILYPKTLKEINKYILKTKSELYIEGQEVEEDYIVNEGDTFTTKSILIDEILLNEIEEVNEEISDVIEKEIIEVKLEPKKEVDNIIESKTVYKNNTIIITVNGKEVELDGSSINLFFQVFNYIDVDLSNVKSLKSLLLNGKPANYTDVLTHGDIIEVVCG